MSANQSYGITKLVQPPDDGKRTYTFSEDVVKDKLGIPAHKRIMDMHQDYHTGELIIITDPIKDAA